MTFKNSNVAFAENIGNITDGIFNKIANKPPYLPIFSDWKAAVGEDFAEKSVPYKVVTQGNKKILVIKSKKGCSVELQHSSVQLLANIHHFLGKPVFSFIKVIQMDIDESL